MIAREVFTKRLKNMKKLYFIAGNWDNLTKDLPTDPNAKRCDAREVAKFVNADYDYIRRIFPSGKEFVLETNLATGERLLLQPANQHFGKGMFLPGNEDIMLNCLNYLKKCMGYFPLKMVDLPL
jgi:hypothetical protein